MHTSFNIYYGLAKKYFEHYGNLSVPRNFKTLDGITYDEHGYALGKWIPSIRHYYKNHDGIEERRDLLQAIGMVFDLHELNFDRMYLLACKYYTFYGDLEVPFRFKTKDGINQDPKGYALGQWVVTQRNAYNYDEAYPMERYNKLNDIAMNWSIRTK